MDVLEVVQRFANATGIPEPSTAVANQADDIIQIVELLNQEGRQLSRRHDWQRLTYEATFTTAATESQGTLASIIGATQTLRRIKNDLMWNRTQRVPVCGPASPKQWQALKALGLTTGPWAEYRIRGGTLMFNPVPTAGETVAFEYVSNCWCTNAAGSTYRRNVAADDDELLLDDELVLAGLEWRWLRKKGLSYAEEFASYEGVVNEAMGSDGTKRTLSMDGGEKPRTPGIVVPVGSWNL